MGNENDKLESLGAETESMAGGMPLDNSLSLDELTLMLRSAVVGASRVDEQVVAPETSFFENLASKAWDFASDGRKRMGRKRLGADERMPQNMVTFRSIPCAMQPLSSQWRMPSPPFVPLTP